MNQTNTTTGVVCGKCSTFTNKVRHADVAAVRECHQDAAAAFRAHQVPQAESPYRSQCDSSTIDVTAGRYAIVRWHEIHGRYRDTEVEFFKVDRPTEGKWAGRTFVKRQAGDDLYPVKSQYERGKILEAIAKDPQEAMLRYGREIGSCGYCGRTLTNAESRELGIGPICRGKMGW